MKHVSLIFFPLLSCFASFCQVNDRERIKEISPFSIGDSLAKYKSFITCAGAVNNGKPYEADLNCKIYQSLPGQKDSFSFDGIKFSAVYFTTDDLKTIKTIMYYKGYAGAYSGPKEKELQNEYDTLVNYFNDIFQMAGLKEKTAKNKYFIQTGMTWKKERLKLLLQKTSNKNATSGKNVTNITITLLQE